jgi:hypothetical protein
MPLEFLFFAAIGVLVIVGAVLAAANAGQMGTGLRLLAALVLVPVVPLSLFGLLASREPGTSPAWAALHGSVLLACLVACVRLLVCGRRPS